MTQHQLKSANGLRPFNNLVNHFFTPFPSLMGETATAVRQGVPVNIRKVENGYELQFSAPGLSKSDFRISLEKSLLTVAADRKESTEEQNDGYVRREFRQTAFTRSFTLDESIDSEKIGAAYENGILTLTLPRKEEVKDPVKQITIQ